MGFYEMFDRPFHPVSDWTFLGPDADFVGSSYGHLDEVLAVVGVGVLVLALLVLMTFTRSEPDARVGIRHHCASDVGIR
jgi:hypothetical protein